ncbi:prepilin peptidase [Rhodococcus sp. NPDC058521]|uniref:prepilin peptidase n=1 Tax=Rhodococcus sp. NPDC058521 TaxID=3346536 RepID=UPI003658E0D1
MGWIQLCGVAWGVGVGIGIGGIARGIADRFAMAHPISFGWCEAAGAASCAGIGWWGATNQVTAEVLVSMIAVTALVGWSIAASAVDIAVRRLPNVLTCAGFAAAVGYGVVTGAAATPVMGSALLSASYLAAYLCAPGSVGAGDVKLALGTGGAASFGGADCWLAAGAGAPLITALVGAGFALLRSRSMSTSLPHGASMCLATVCSVLVVAV